MGELFTTEMKNGNCYGDRIILYLGEPIATFHDGDLAEEICEYLNRTSEEVS